MKANFKSCTQDLIDSKHLELCVLTVKDTLCRTQCLETKNVRQWLQCLPPVTVPIVSEGLDAQKGIAKATFKKLPQPAKNLLLGLTELETQLSETKCLSEEAGMSTVWDSFQAHLDTLMGQCNVVQDSCVDIFRECEQRIQKDWLEQVSEDSIADLCMEVSSFVTAMDTYAEKKFGHHSVVWPMYLEIRAFDEDSSDKDLQALYKKSISILGHAKECYEFLRKRVVSNHAIQTLSDAAFQKADKAAEDADVRFHLHDLYRQRQHGLHQPKEPKNIEEWTSHLNQVHSIENTLVKKKTETESVKSVSYAEEWTSLTKDFELAEMKARQLKELTANVRVKTAHSYRKKQEALIKAAVQKWALFQVSLPDIVVEASTTEQGLVHTKSLMLTELGELQKTFRFTKTDIDVIFQSVTSGIFVASQAKAQEFLQENVNRTESVLRSFVDWSQRMQAILC